MIEQLRKVYTTLLIVENTNESFNPNYKWFISDKQEIIGIHEDELTSKDLSLLQAFLTPYEVQYPQITSEEQRWLGLVGGEDLSNQKENNHPYRFVYFSINRQQINPRQFKSAICELFGREIPILWQGEFEGMIVEEKLIHEEITSYEQIIDVLMSDLFVKIKFLVGSFKNDLQDVQQYYHSLLNAAAIVFNYSNKNVMTYADAIPYLFVDQMAEEQSRYVSESILQEYLHDEETKRMIETFVSCHLNISETAKALHMHRNSLQYRLDRFNEKTGLDIRQFHHAMTAYLALLSKYKQDAQKSD